MGDKSNVPHPKCMGRQNKTQYETKNLSKEAKNRVRVFADIQNFALCVCVCVCVCTACTAFPNVSMTLCNWQICHTTHAQCGCTTFGTELKLGTK